MTEDIIPPGYIRVTDVLNPFTKFDHIDPLVLQNAADRGNRVHALCDAYANNQFICNVPDDCKNYFERFCEWFDSSVHKVLNTEERLNHPDFRISGKYDMVVQLNGDSAEMLTLVDLKTPATESNTWRLQTAAYKILLNEVKKIVIAKRLIVMLPKTGKKYKTIEYKEHALDQDLYMSALELYKYFNPKLFEKPCM